MENSSYSHKSPAKAMFSSVFKREDIKVRSNSNVSTSKYHVRSQSSYNESTPLRVSYNTTTNFLKSDNFSNISLNESSAKSPVTSYKYLDYKENSLVQKVSPKKEIIHNNTEDSSKKYERMQEYYVTQIERLNEEVNHYKSLYYKLLAQSNAEKKMFQRN